MNQLLIAIVVAVGVMLGAAALQSRSDSAKITTLKQQLANSLESEQRTAKALKLARTALIDREARLAEQARALRTSRSDLAEALQSNKNWSATHVPADVQKAVSGLSGPADGLQND